MKSTQEFIEHLKTLYEDCQVYFDIQEKKIIIKNQRTKEEREEEIKYTDEFKRARVKYQELISAGATGLPELPTNTEECYSDRVYQPAETHFQWLITKLDEWETSQNKKVENVGSLVEFIEWTATEQDKLRKEEAETQEKQFQEMLSALWTLELEQTQKAIDDVWKNNIHRDFTPELQKQWEENGFGYEQVKEWIGVGLKPQDGGYAAWLRDMLELSPLDYLGYLFSSFDDGSDKLLREQYQGYLQPEEDEDSLLAKALALSLGNDENSLGEEKTRNILLIGRTGSGKSTLGNVLVNKNDNFEEVFKESAGSVSQTKEIKTEKFTVKLSRDGTQQIHYLVIDTIGFGDTQLETKDILQLLKGLVPIIKQNGLNQIFFVSDGRFTEKEINTYKLLETVLFDREVVNYTTIVRTRFPKFESLDDCEKDRQKLRAENDEIFKILQASKIIYVNNPPLEGRLNLIKMNKELREESHKRLLTHLAGYQDDYKPDNIDDLDTRINDFMTQEQALTKEISEKEQEIQKREAELQKEIETIQQEKARDLRITGRNFERQVQELQAQSEKKVQTTRQELEEVNQAQLLRSQEAHNQALNQINSACQSNLSQIRDIHNHIRVGEPICRYGHDNNIQVYNKYGLLISDYQSDFIGHIFCPTCGQTQTDYTLRNATTYTLEEWGRRSAQQAAERNRRMEEEIREQEQQRQNMINRISQERTNREAEYSRALEQQKRTQEEIVNQQKRLNEQRLSNERQASEGWISSSSLERERRLQRELNEKKRELEEQIRQSEAKKDNSRQQMEAYIEQRLRKN